jgi:hypothetical protein
MSFLTLCIPLVETTANAAETKGAAVPTGGSAKWRVVGAELHPDTNRTANDTNYATLALKVGSTTLGSFTTETTGSGGVGNLVALTPVAFGLSDEEGNPVVAGSSSVNVAVTKAASGVAVTGIVTVLLEAVRA